MNWIPERDFPCAESKTSTGYAAICEKYVVTAFAIFCVACLQGCGVSESESAETPKSVDQYRMDFVVSPDRSDGSARVELKVSQSGGQLRQITMRIDPERFADFRGDGRLQIAENSVSWYPSDKGGTLQWTAAVTHARATDSYDAFMDTNWALFRAEDVIPRASSRTLKGTSSETWLSFELPAGWSSVTPYFGRDHKYRVDNPRRRFDLPGGWIALGKIGVRIEIIAGIDVKIAAPEGQDVRRMDAMALLQWTIPEALKVLPGFPARLTVLSAGDPMWRGGLSGPQSLFIHADRPLISENATSTLLHETFHVAFGPAAAPGADWIIEGLAEYYSLQFLARSGTISERRLGQALATQANWGRKVSSICVPRSTGAVTARAVMILATLDREIAKSTERRHSLDDVTRTLAVHEGKISLATLRAVTERLTGRVPDALLLKNLPGCAE